MEKLLLIAVTLLGFTTNMFSQDIEFHRGVNNGNFDFVNKSSVTEEIRTQGDLILHDGAQVLGDNMVIYCRNFILEGNAALRHNSLNFMIIYSGYTNSTYSKVVFKKEKNVHAKTIIPFLSGNITLFRNGKVYIWGDYVKISKSYLTQGKYIVVYDNGNLSGNFTIKG